MSGAPLPRARRREAPRLADALLEIDEALDGASEFLERVYNQKRLHSALGYVRQPILRNVLMLHNDLGSPS